MEQAILETVPLTLGELSELLNRHMDNVPIAKVIKDAIERRVSDASRGAPETQEGGVLLPITCSGICD